MCFMDPVHWANGENESVAKGEKRAESAGPIHSFHFIGVRIKWRNRGSSVVEDYLNHEVTHLYSSFSFSRLLHFLTSELSHAIRYMSQKQL